jgi:hypothetical protein
MQNKNTNKFKEDFLNKNEHDLEYDEEELKLVVYEELPPKNQWRRM